MKIRWVILPVFFAFHSLFIPVGLGAGGGHDGDQPAAGGGGGGKPNLKVTATDKLDPKLEMGPININDAVRAVLAVTSKNKKTIQDDRTLDPKEKAARIKMIEDFQKVLLDMTVTVRSISTVALAINVCGSFEFDLGFIFPERWTKVVTPGVKGQLCLTLAGTRNSGTGAVDGIVIGGPTVIAGAQLERTKKDIQGDVTNSEIALGLGVSVLFPISQKPPKTKLGDLQGFYGGVNAEVAFSSNNRMLSALKTGSGSVHIRVPDLDVMMVSLARTSSNQRSAINLQAEAMYYLTPWATDGSTYRLPWKTGPHSDHAMLERSVPPEVAKQLEDPEIQKLIKSGELDKRMKASIQEMKTQTGTK